MQALQQAAMRRPPRATGDSAPGANFQTAVSTSSVTNVAVLPSGGPTTGGCWVTFRTNVDVRIRFGLSGIAAAVSTDYLIPAGQSEEFWICFPDDAFFSALGAAAGLLDRFRSDR